jgi:copper chaperone
MTTFAVPEMSCDHCSASIQTALAALDPGATVETSIKERILRLETRVSDAQVLMTLNEIGYAANVRG